MELTRRVLWRVPLISLIAGFFYLPLCVRFLLAFGGTNPWAETLFHLLYLAVVLGAGWALFLRKLTRREIFLTSLVVTAYALILALLQSLLGASTGPMAVVFLYLSTPLQWTALFSGPAVNLGLPRSLYWLVTLLNAAVPLLFALPGRKG